MASNKSSGGGIGIFGAAGIVLVTLKVANVKPVSDWPWVWVLAPFWFGFAAVLILIAFILLIVWLAAKYE